ncbi:hypothetical protein K443DRAFT_372546 [Laccaria amethystina LaAM-08-1]|uniref:Uncharacterized protein n=1 Tax=Laccaria amethystina LaAM-08-1 TaxID=1095629 RepID=A0A0C9WRI0_9AGAR|nr:hypothetical protein K443DRAFT_372546 [Laccaria amethystina LaAM-08-1]
MIYRGGRRDQVIYSLGMTTDMRCQRQSSRHQPLLTTEIFLKRIFGLHNPRAQRAPLPARQDCVRNTI